MKAMCHFTLMDSIASPLQESVDGTARCVTITEMLKPLVIWSQYMLILSGQSVSWPTSLSAPLHALGWFWSSTSPQTISLECLVPKDSVLHVAPIRVLLGLCMPVLMLVVILLIDEVANRLLLHAKHHGISTRGQVARTASVVAFTFMPSVVRSLFSLFACVPLDQAMAPPYMQHAVGSFWESDMSQECYTGYHKGWAFGLGIPLVFLVCCGLPGWIAFLCYRNRSRLDDESVKRHWGFLYHTYTPAYCWWEAVVICQTCVLIGVSVFGFTIGEYYQNLLLNATLALAMVLLLIVKPHASPLVGLVTLQCIGCLFLTSYVALTFVQAGSIQPPDAYKEIMGALVLFANVVYVCSLVWRMFQLANVVLLMQQLSTWVSRVMAPVLHWCGAHRVL